MGVNHDKYDLLILIVGQRKRNDQLFTQSHRPSRSRPDHRTALSPKTSKEGLSAAAPPSEHHPKHDWRRSVCPEVADRHGVLRPDSHRFGCYTAPRILALPNVRGQRALGKVFCN